MKKQDMELFAYWEANGLKFRKTNAKRKKRITCFVKFFVFFTFSFVISQELTRLNDMYNHTSPEIACLYYRTQFLNVLENTTILPNKSIFMVNPYCCGELTTRQSCAIEAAALKHPDWQINVLQAGFDPGKYSQPITMRNLKNVVFWKINIEDFAAGTMLEDLVKSKFIKNVCLDKPKVVDILKYLALSKWPGLFIDTEVIVGRSLEFMPKNWAVRIDELNIAQSMLSFSEDAVGRDIAERAVREIRDHYLAWCKTPDTMRRVLKGYCKTRVDEWTSLSCNGFHLFREEFMYPLTKEMAFMYFGDEDVPAKGALAYNLFGKGSERIPPSHLTPYNRIAREHCPKTFEWAKSRRGIQHR